MQAGLEPVDVVVDDSRRRLLAAVVEDDEYRELAATADAVLGRLPEVVDGAFDGGWRASGHLESGDDVVVKEVVEAASNPIAP